MSNQTSIYCIVDDTALITNLDEVGPWVQAGTVNLVVPLYSKSNHVPQNEDRIDIYSS